MNFEKNILAAMIIMTIVGFVIYYLWHGLLLLLGIALCFGAFMGITFLAAWAVDRLVKKPSSPAAVDRDSSIAD